MTEKHPRFTMPEGTESAAETSSDFERDGPVSTSTPGEAVSILQDPYLGDYMPEPQPKSHPTTN